METRMIGIDKNKFELIELQKVLDIINSNRWNDVDFVVSLKKENDNLTKFNFNDCIDKEIIDAIKKLIKVGFERAIEKRK